MHRRGLFVKALLALLAPFLLLAGPDVGPSRAQGPPEAAFPPVPGHLDRQAVIAFTRVNVVPMAGPTILPNQTVVVRQGRIAAMGPSGQVPVPEDAVVIDGDGRYLMPGLADMHVHLLHPEDMLLYLANGVTTVRNMWGTVDILGWRTEVATGQRLGPRIYTASRGLDGSPAFWETSLVVDDSTAARAAVAAEAALGFDFIKVYTNLSREAYDAIIAAAAERRLPVVGHVPRKVGIDRVLAAGQASVEHLGWVPQGLDDEALAALAKQAAQSGTWFCPTLVVQTRFVDSVEAAQLAARPEMRFVHPEMRATWRPTPNAPSRKLRQARALERGRVVRAFRAEGVRLLLGTDSWISYVIPGFSIHEELAMLVGDAGLSPFDALRAGTSDPARSIGATGTWGTVVVGASADLLLLRANPLQDVRHVQERSGVMVAGAWYSQAELDRRLEALADRYATAR